MSESVEKRTANVLHTLELITQETGDKWIEMILIDPTRQPWSQGILTTTWDELQAQGYIRSRLTRYYTPTARGWLKGMELVGKKDDPEFQEQVGRISAVLKDSVKGREQPAFIFPEAVAKESGQPLGLVRNVISSRLVNLWWNKTEAELDPKGQIITVPKHYGLELLSTPPTPPQP